MKKLTTLLILVFCFSFTQLSAQVRTIRWAVIGYAGMSISVNGITKLPWTNAPGNSIAYGSFDVNVGDIIEVFGGDSTGYRPLDAIMTEDDDAMIQNQRNYPPDWNFVNAEHTSLYEYFEMNYSDMYIEMSS